MTLLHVERPKLRDRVVPPTTRYAKHGDRNIAYQVLGEGGVDIVHMPSFVSHVELFWADPTIKAYLDRLAAFSRCDLPTSSR